MTDTKLNTEIINEILGIEESYKAPERLMEILFDKELRESVFKQFLNIETNLDFDWFHVYFQDEHSDRKNKKQDFTPDSVGQLLSELVGTSENGGGSIDITAGTGGLLIKKWNEDKWATNFFHYRPSMFFYQAEEMSDRAVPFLLFNLLIRGMNGTVVHGNALTREIKDVYFIQNFEDNYLAFSDLNIMPRTASCEQEFNVLEWVGAPADDIVESKEFPPYLGGLCEGWLD